MISSMSSLLAYGAYAFSDAVIDSYGVDADILLHGPERWETFVQSHVRFNRVPGEGSGEGLGGLGAEQVPEGFWWRAGPGFNKASRRLCRRSF